jgi:hypothetical protein
MLAFVGAAIVGCGTRAPPGSVVVANGKAALERATLCCKDLSTAPRLPLPLEQTVVKLNGNSPAFDFGGNKAFFVLYELPRYERPYSIFLASQAAGSQQDVAVFVPRVALYDASHRVTRYFDERSLRNRGNDLERTVFINPADSGERYIAIYGSDLTSSIERAYSMVTVQSFYPGFVYFSGVDGKSNLHTAPTGDVRVEVQGLTPAVAKK